MKYNGSVHQNNRDIYREMSRFGVYRITGRRRERQRRPDCAFALSETDVYRKATGKIIRKAEKI